jgi:hypothetical protein
VTSCSKQSDDLENIEYMEKNAQILKAIDVHVVGIYNKGCWAFFGKQLSVRASTWKLVKEHTIPYWPRNISYQHDQKRN